jgi:DNA-binding NtrC family response regulator
MRPPRANVVVVDDEAIVLRSVVRVLERDGYVTRACASVAEAREALTDPTFMPDLVLTDLHLTDGSGLDVAEIVRREHPTVCTIFMTGRATVADAVEAMRVGAWDFLVKPRFRSTG